MSGMIRRFFIKSFLIILILSPCAGYAASTVDCHCFRDRNFSAENPKAFDPYLLATVQNRLLAYSFNLPRKEIVSEKMSGTSGDHLWIKHWIAETKGLEAEEIQKCFDDEGSWIKVITTKKVDPEELGSDFMKAMAERRTEQMAWAVVTQVFAAGHSVSAQQFHALQDVGASLKEAVLATVLALMTSDDPEIVFADARSKGNWGSLLIAAGISIDSIDAFLAKSFLDP